MLTVGAAQLMGTGALSVNHVTLSVSSPSVVVAEPSDIVSNNNEL